MKIKLALTLVLTLYVFLQLKAQNTYKCSQFLYGAAYYYEYNQSERLDKDVQLMVEAGINFVRIGESTWGVMEPEDGAFDFSPVIKVLDAMHKVGIKVIVGTPTYSIPAWMARKYPEILVTTLDGKATFGVRQNMDITHPAYLYHAERIIRKMMEAVHNHPAIIGYIVDNENKSYGTSSANVQINFVKYLKDKFKTTKALNAAWGLNFWGQNIASWDDFPSRKGTYQPSYQLEWDKFQRTIPFDFLAWQAKIVSEYKKPGQFVTHNFDVHPDNNGYGPKVDLNHFMMAKIFDISGMDIYNGSQEDIGPERISWVDDYTRSLKRDNFFILETQAQTIGWGATSAYPPFEGQLRQSVYSHLSGGANMVAYWHWSTTHNGVEMYCKGILGPDYYPGRAFSDVKQIAAEINKYGSKLINMKKHNDVALLYSYNSNSAFVYQALDNSFYYNTMVNQVYGSMFRQNISMDIVFEDDYSYLSDYKLIVVPSLYIASDGLLKALSNYVKNGGNLLLLPHTGYCDENFKVRSEIMPGILAETCGLTYHEFSKIKDKLPIKGNPFGLEPADNYAKIWTDMLIPGKAEVLANYEHFFFGKYPMLTYNKFGKGSVIYQGAYVSDKLQEKIVLLATEKAGLKTIDQDYYFPIIAKHGQNTDNKTVNYLFNYSSKLQTISYNFKKGKILFTNVSVENGDKLDIKPWDLIIVIEE